MERTKVRYQVPDTSAMRELIAAALLELRHEAKLERGQWAEYAVLLEAVA